MSGHWYSYLHLLKLKLYCIYKEPLFKVLPKHTLIMLFHKSLFKKVRCVVKQILKKICTVKLVLLQYSLLMVLLLFPEISWMETLAWYKNFATCKGVKIVPLDTPWTPLTSSGPFNSFWQSLNRLWCPLNLQDFMVEKGKTYLQEKLISM